MDRKKSGIICFIGAATILCFVVFVSISQEAQKQDPQKNVTETQKKHEESSEETAGVPDPEEETLPEATKEPEEETLSGPEIALVGDEVAASQSQNMAEAVRLIETAKEFLGTPHNYIGTSPSTGFSDLSYVTYCMKQAGIADFKVTSYDILYSRCLSESTETYLPGDLIFFEQGGNLCHVGIYLGNHRMIHCGTNVEQVELQEGWEEIIATFGRVCSYGTQPDREGDYEKYVQEN